MDRRVCHGRVGDNRNVSWARSLAAVATIIVRSRFTNDFYSLFRFNSIDEAGLRTNNGNNPPFIKVPDSWPNLQGRRRGSFLTAENKVVNFGSTTTEREPDTRDGPP
jgi:hypothetical protein